MNFAEIRLDGQPMNQPTPTNSQPINSVDSATDAVPADADKTLDQKINDALHEVFDPEIPVDIYELGLIYDVDIDEEKNVNIKMTLTSPACPVAESLPLEVRSRVSILREVQSCNVEIVFDPPWTQDRMSDAAKLKLGMF